MLQNDRMHALSTVIVAPTSTSVRPASFRPEVDVVGTRTKVLVEQLAAVDPSRLGEAVGSLRHGELRDVERALGLVLDLELRNV